MKGHENFAKNMGSSPENFDARKKLSEILQIPFRNFDNKELTPICYGAIFSLKNDIIYQYKKEYYEYLLNICETFHHKRMPIFKFGHMMEFSWMEIFRYDPPKELYQDTL